MLRWKPLKKSTITSTYHPKLSGYCSRMPLLSHPNLVPMPYLCFFCHHSHLVQRCRSKIFVANSRSVSTFLNACVQMVTLVLMSFNILRSVSSSPWPLSLERLLSWRKRYMFGWHLMTLYDTVFCSYALVLSCSHALMLVCSLFIRLLFIHKHTNYNTKP